MDDDEQKLNINADEQEPDTSADEQEPDTSADEQELDTTDEEELDTQGEEEFDTNDDEYSPKRRFFKVLPIFGALAFFASIPLSVYYNNGLFSVFAAVFFTACFIPTIVVFFIDLKKALKDNSEIPRTPEREQELIDEVNSAQDRTESRIALAKYHGREADSVGELVASSFGLDKKSRDAFKESSISDKFKVIAIFGAFGLCMLVMMVGVAFANADVGYIGFPLMGAGGGGFFLVIAVLVLMQRLKKNDYFKDRAYSENDRRDNEIIVSGKVFRCVPYCVKQKGDFRRGSHIPRISVNMYQITVIPEGTNRYINFVCSKYYTEGDAVEFLQDVDHPRKMRLIEEERYPYDHLSYDDAVEAHLSEIKKSLEEKKNVQGDDYGVSRNDAMNAMLLEARRRIEAKRNAELEEANGDENN